MNIWIIVFAFCLVMIGILIYFVWSLKKKLDACQRKQPLAAAAGGVIRPLNGQGQPVDWFVVFKLPNKSKNCSNDSGSCADVCDCSGCVQPSNCDYWNTGSSAAGDRASGECYFYADSNNPTLQYYTDLGYGCLSDASSPLSQSLQQLTSGKWALWNDQGVASECSAPHAHSKGAVCYNAQGGFILNTSSPHWPNSDLQPMGCQKTSNTEYAQHVFCFSASAPDIDKWLQAVQNASLCITESSFLNTGPLSGGSTPAPLAINTLGGVPITVLVKGSQDNYSPWSLVAESLQTGLSVASWTSDSSGASGWGSAAHYNGGSHPLAQILDINTPHGCFKSVYSYSHSKWAISDAGNWVIFGSMNQQDSQAARGGDFYAFQNPSLWQSLKGFISSSVPR